ncbi:MAG: hypothetical protein ACJ780_12990, partial [Solirubrobacteraceae bacterium]
MTPKWWVLPSVGRPCWQRRHHEAATPGRGLVAGAIRCVRGRHRRFGRGGSRNRFDVGRGRRNPQRAGAAGAHPKLPAHADRSHTNSNHDRVHTDYDRVDTDYDRVDTDYDRVDTDYDRVDTDYDRAITAVESSRPSLHEADRDGSFTTARVGNRERPAADLAGCRDRRLCPDRGCGVLRLPRSGDRRDPTHSANVGLER